MNHHTEDCPECGDPLEMPDDDGLVACPECGTHWDVTLDGDGEYETGVGVHWRALYSLTKSPNQPCRHPPAAWRSCDQCRDAQAGV